MYPNVTIAAIVKICIFVTIGHKKTVKHRNLVKLTTPYHFSWMVFGRQNHAHLKFIQLKKMSVCCRDKYLLAIVTSQNLERNGLSFSP